MKNRVNLAGVIAAAAILAVASISLSVLSLAGCDNGTPDHEHSFSAVWHKDEAHHWKECTISGCEEEGSYAVHSGNPCGTCEYDNTPVIAEGAALSAPPTAAGATIEDNSITITAVAAPSNGQTVEYAINAANTAPETGWQDSPAFTALDAGTTYYIFARSKANNAYNSGDASAGLEVKTTRTSDPITNNSAYGKFSVAQVRDTKRSPSLPNNGQPMILSGFTAPKPDGSQSSISAANLDTAGAYFQLTQSSTYTEVNKRYDLKLYKPDGTVLQNVSTNGSIVLFFNEGFLFVGGASWGYIFFYDPIPAGTTQITVTSFTMP